MKIGRFCVNLINDIDAMMARMVRKARPRSPRRRVEVVINPGASTPMYALNVADADTGLEFGWVRRVTVDLNIETGATVKVTCIDGPGDNMLPAGPEVGCRTVRDGEVHTKTEICELVGFRVQDGRRVSPRLVENRDDFVRKFAAEREDIR